MRILYNDTYKPAICIIYDLLHGILEFQLALIPDHGDFTAHPVHNQFFHGFTEYIRPQTPSGVSLSFLI